MFEKLTSAEEIYSYKLGAALTMERTTLDMLADLEDHAQRDDLKRLFREHATETKQHVANVERAFQMLGEDVDSSPCPAIQGLEKEGQATIKKTDDRLVDAVLLASANETEHHEIAVYETLITNAEARGATGVADLLRQNLAQEQAALEKVQAFAHRIAHEGIAVNA
jgi:ferritin-like metal-binding protein YciE